MQKLKKIVENWYFDGKAKKPLTMVEMGVLVGIYKNLKEKKRATFIHQSIADLLTELGFDVQKQGIGWLVYPKEEKSR